MVAKKALKATANSLLQIFQVLIRFNELEKLNGRKTIISTEVLVREGEPYLGAPPGGIAGKKTQQRRCLHVGIHISTAQYIVPYQDNSQAVDSSDEEDPKEEELTIKQEEIRKRRNNHKKNSRQAISA